ncbi:hypothetical protein CLV62_12429 [Dysgonomonas alginatilytica]|uniref:LysM domain-containing protein n=1 Tax=Dysgonomonas alginatilytica TaxID=1605892 RepID=A0A2V3PKD9_9BACT|nr:hypothetical protein [Dysgonomonas alginatilytica]PXV61874.1 hypothetical protein CLV62_12429 [Dysgonomonas alginatilytica]
MGKSGKSRKKKRRNSSTRHLFILFIVLCVLAGGYYYLKIYSREEVAVNPTLDKTAQYSILENNDSTQYLAVIIYQDNVSINTIASTFYKNEMFWPYIYIENKAVIRNPLNMGRDVILKIPRLSDDLINVNDTASVRIAKDLADSILNDVTDPI